MLRTFNSNGLKIYSLSAGKSTPQFSLEWAKNSRKLKGDAEFQHRIELIHDLEFPQCCDTISISPDSRYIIASGTYPPQIGIYDTLELSLKHRRGIDNEVLKTCFLESDYTKLAFLCRQRVIEFHNRGGRHHSIRIPNEGRDMKYLSDHSSLITANASNQLFRVNLERGVFEEPLTSVCSETNCLSENPILPLVSAGGNKCILESWDLRSQKSASKFSCSNNLDDSVTSCEYSSNGLKVAVGTEYGMLKLYDIRNSKPIWEKENINGTAINCIEWINSVNHYTTDIGENSLIAWSDNKSVRIHEIENGNFVVSVEGLNTNDKKQGVIRINGFSFYPDSGICFIVGDQTRVGTYFVPHIGPAPTWCSFLENITEEMEIPNATNTGVPTAKQQIYDGHVFVTKQQLEELNAVELIGTKLVKDYMHGYFIDSRTYRNLKNLTSDFDFEEYRKQKLHEKIEKNRQMRIPVRQKKVKVNPELVEKLEASASVDTKGLTKKEREAALRAKSALEDERFSKLFTDENFAIDHIDVNNAKYKK
ncbi:hypothetical protein BEWA_005160 [Theileria equi strain WA]|uniref:Uncharacterized protein n=1 Tax=Theileria equi strain WA TaxID=1537102 RepID=L0B0R5_THEEQ|nr:hypothetical protein BEWA_005160 [Theileria equi strain WA]AFZ81108.1 hypothetical protein BEWA_005160 [Theileria equi strain WA]|eukprot:XP_004830774.1 hypothetical protein BEWA_005160 [Theileria equi strain WA]